jgi:hypothetical protein
VSTRVNNIYRIIAAITIQVQTVDGFGVQVGGIVRGDEAAPLRRVIAGVTVVQTRIVVAIVTAIDNIIVQISLFIVKKNI